MDSIKYCPNCESGITVSVKKYDDIVLGGKGKLLDSYWSCRTGGIRFDEL